MQKCDTNACYGFWLRTLVLRLGSQLHLLVFDTPLDVHKGVDDLSGQLFHDVHN
jgi:hypothetical protein